MAEMQKQEGKKLTRAEKIAKKYQNMQPQMLPGGGRRGPGGPGGRGPRGGMGGKPKDAKKSLGRLLSYITEDIGKIAIVFIFVVINAVASLAGSYMLRPIIDTYIAPVDGSRGSVGGLAAALAVMAAIYVVAVAASYLQSRIMVGVSQKAI